MLFFYQVKKKSGCYTWKMQFACSKIRCLRILIKKRHYPYRFLSLQDFWENKIFQREKSIQAKHWIYFFKKLSTQLHSGKSLSNALKSLKKIIHFKEQKYLIEEALECLVVGQHFYPLLKNPNYNFSHQQIKLLKCAEMSGYLVQGIDRIYEQLLLKEKIKNQIQQNLIYPCCILFFTMIFCGFLSFFLMPRFQDFFIHQGLPLNGFISLIFSLNCKLPYLIFAFISLIFIIFLFFKYHKNYFKYLLEHYFYKFFKPLHYSFFAISLADLLEQNIPLIESLRLSLPQLSNYVSCEKVTFLLQQGIPLSYALKEFPDDVIQILQAVEINTQLIDNLRNLSKTYYKIYENRLLQFAKWIEPACLIFLACFVFVIVFSLFYPLVQLFQGVDLITM